MTTLSSMLGKVDPRKEGLPMFGIGYSGSNMNEHFSLRVIDSNFNIAGSPWSAMSNSTNNYGQGMNADAMWNYSNASPDMGTMHTQLSSEQYGSYAAWLNSCHQHDQYPMGMYVDVSADGMMNGQTLHSFSYTKVHRGRYLINQVLPEGCRPRRYFQLHDNVFRECSGMGSLRYGFDSVQLGVYRDNTSHSVGRGSAGYNEKTKTLVTLHYSSTDVTVNRFVSTVDLNHCKNLVEFFDNATVTSSTGNRTGTSNTGDTVVVVGDNGYVACQYRHGNSLYADLIAPDNTYTTGFYSEANGTTSYGTEQGTPYYNKMQLSWDGKWAAAFSAYYYYGSGILAHFFSTEDPRRYMTTAMTKTLGSVLMPIGPSGFMMASSDNTDSQSVYMNQYDFTNTDRTNHADTTVYSHTNDDGPTNIGSGGTLNPDMNPRNNLHGGYGTTCYPKFFTINQWPTDKAFAKA